ncbi:MAG: adenylate kinase family enzyme [Planctomycetota bacterium]|jgi:adenylate kinase family enzyme
MESTPQKILVVGNSGSGKSTLAKLLVAEHGLAHLDLDKLAWLPTSPPTRAPLADSAAAIAAFVSEHEAWVVEGCYTDLLVLMGDQAEELIFLKLSVEDCISNARSRPWEPHKYASKAAQDENLEMLVDWIAGYAERTDTFSLAAHEQFFESFKGSKLIYESNR